MSNALPRLHQRPYDAVHGFIAEVLTGHKRDQTSLRQLEVHADGRYRAFFTPDYFVLAAGASEPSKSQWNGLKKKLKRHHPGVFIFKEHGMASCQGALCCWVDFGFFAERPADH
jgi:hypothetical protein